MCLECVCVKVTPAALACLLFLQSWWTFYGLGPTPRGSVSVLGFQICTVCCGGHVEVSRAPTREGGERKVDGLSSENATN